MVDRDSYVTAAILRSMSETNSNAQQRMQLRLSQIKLNRNYQKNVHQLTAVYMMNKTVT
jgi:hypothetical protein